jgi:hypothetical protein
VWCAHEISSSGEVVIHRFAALQCVEKRWKHFHRHLPHRDAASASSGVADERTPQQSRRLVGLREVWPDALAEGAEEVAQEPERGEELLASGEESEGGERQEGREAGEEALVQQASVQSGHDRENPHPRLASAPGERVRHACDLQCPGLAARLRG